jgi:hypothetical protein
MFSHCDPEFWIMAQSHSLFAHNFAEYTPIQSGHNSCALKTGAAESLALASTVEL